MHDLKKVYEIVSKNKNDWTFNGYKVTAISYVRCGDEHKLMILYDDHKRKKVFTSTFTHDMEDDDCYTGVGVCFLDSFNIRLRNWEDDADETVSHKLTNTKVKTKYTDADL